MSIVAEFRERVRHVCAAEQSNLAWEAYNQIGQSLSFQDYDTVAQLVEEFPEQWIPAQYQPTWLLAGAFAVMHSTQPSLPRQRALMDRFNALCLRPYRAANSLRPPRPRRRKKIAVGFMGALLAGTIYAERLVREVLQKLDRDRLEVHAICLSSSRPLDKEWLGVDCVHEIGDEISGQHHLRALGLDVLVYLDGITPSLPWRLLASRSVPRQLSWLHTHLTFGGELIDGHIGDTALFYEHERAWYAEPIFDIDVTANSCCLLTRYTDPGPGPISRTGAIQFGSFNRLSKISHTCAAAWGRILQALPTATLHIVRESLHVPAERLSLEERFQQAGVPMNQVIFFPGGGDDTYYGYYNNVDLVLDTFPFVGGLTCFDTLAQSVPILTLEGLGLVERLSATMLRLVDEPDLITRTVDEYVAQAISLAGQPQRLTDLRLSLRERAVASPVFDMTSLARRMSDLLVAQAAR